MSYNHLFQHRKSGVGFYGYGDFSGSVDIFLPAGTYTFHKNEDGSAKVGIPGKALKKFALWAAVHKCIAVLERV